MFDKLGADMRYQSRKSGEQRMSATALHVVPDVDEQPAEHVAQDTRAQGVSEFVLRRLSSSSRYATVSVLGSFPASHVEREQVMRAVNTRLVGRGTLVSVSTDQLVATFNVLDTEDELVQDFGQWLADEFGGESTDIRVVDATDLESSCFEEPQQPTLSVIR